MSAASPSASGTAYATPIPGAPSYLGGQAGALAAYQKAVARVNQQTLDRAHYYGYQGSIDPTSGNLTNLKVDPQNPYGQLQQMLRNQAQEDIGATNDSIGRGLKGGLAHQAESDLRYQHGAQSANLGSTWAGEVAGFQDQKGQAQTDYDNTLWQLQMQAAQDAIANGDFNLADFSGLDYPTYEDVPYTTDTTPPLGSNFDPNNAAMAQLKRDQARGAGGMQSALDARGAGMNALYGKGAAAQGKTVKNPIVTAVKAAAAAGKKPVSSPTKTAAVAKVVAAARPAPKPAPAPAPKAAPKPAPKPAPKKGK